MSATYLYFVISAIHAIESFEQLFCFGYNEKWNESLLIDIQCVSHFANFVSFSVHRHSEQMSFISHSLHVEKEKRLNDVLNWSVNFVNVVHLESLLFFGQHNFSLNVNWSRFFHKINLICWWNKQKKRSKIFYILKSNLQNNRMIGAHRNWFEWWELL